VNGVRPHRHTGTRSTTALCHPAIILAFFLQICAECQATFTAFAGAAAFKPQQEFIRLARTFYASLVEERMLYALEGNWLRCLSDPARSGMAVTAMTGTVSLPGTRARSIGRSFMAISRGTGIAEPGRRGQIAEPNAALVCVVPNGDGRRRGQRRRSC
jgi:hypothetical protein